MKKRHIATIITTVGILGKFGVADANAGNPHTAETTAIDTNITSQAFKYDRSTDGHIDTETRGIEVADRTRHGDDGDDGGDDSGSNRSNSRGDHGGDDGGDD